MSYIDSANCILIKMNRYFSWIFLILKRCGTISTKKISINNTEKGAVIISPIRVSNSSRAR